MVVAEDGGRHKATLAVHTTSFAPIRLHTLPPPASASPSRNLPSPHLPSCGSDGGRHKATLAVPNTSITPSACTRRRRPPSNPPFLRKGIRRQRSDALASTCACRHPSPALATAVDLHLSRRREDIRGLPRGTRGECEWAAASMSRGLDGFVDWTWARVGSSGPNSTHPGLNQDL
jgi:hypothetical protein